MLDPLKDFKNSMIVSSLVILYIWSYIIFHVWVYALVAPFRMARESISTAKKAYASMRKTLCTTRSGQGLLAKISESIGDAIIINPFSTTDESQQNTACSPVCTHKKVGIFRTCLATIAGISVAVFPATLGVLTSVFGVLVGALVVLPASLITGMFFYMVVSTIEGLYSAVETGIQVFQQCLISITGFYTDRTKPQKSFWSNAAEYFSSENGKKKAKDKSESETGDEEETSIWKMLIDTGFNNSIAKPIVISVAGVLLSTVASLLALSVSILLIVPIQLLVLCAAPALALSNTVRNYCRPMLNDASKTLTYLEFHRCSENPFDDFPSTTLRDMYKAAAIDNILVREVS